VPCGSCDPWERSKRRRPAGSDRCADLDGHPAYGICRDGADWGPAAGRALAPGPGHGYGLADWHLAWRVHDARGAVCVLSLRRAGRKEGSFLDSCFSRKSLLAGCEFPHLDRICWLLLTTKLRSRQLCGWSRSRNRTRNVHLAPGHVGAWNAGTKVRRLEDITMVRSFR